jgi:flagellar biosynthesis/type III secretory pathway protein FliH
MPDESEVDEARKEGRRKGYSEGWDDGYDAGRREASDEATGNAYQEGYNDAHNAFIRQIVDTLDFQGQEAMIAHIERAIGFSVSQGNAR